jgi:hypothetical protein
MRKVAPTVPGIFVYPGARHEEEARRSLENAPPGTSRTVYNVRELKLVGMANPPGIFMRREGLRYSLLPSDEVPRMLDPSGFSTRASAFQQLAGLADGESLTLAQTYRQGDRTFVASFLCRPLLRDADGTLRLFVCDYVMEEA